MKQGLLQAFNLWLETARRLRSHQLAVQGALQRMANRLQVAAWIAWRQHTQEQQSTLFTLYGAVSRLKHRKLALSWNLWRAVASELRRQEGLLEAFLKRWYRKQEAITLYYLKELAETFKLEQARLRQAAMLFRSGGIGRMLLRWRLLAVKGRRVRAKAMNGLKRLANMSLALAFNCWRSAAYEVLGDQEQLQNAKRVFAILCGAAKHNAFSFWRQCTTDALREISIQRRAVFMLFKRQLAAAMRCWQENADRLRDGTAAATRAMHYLTKRGRAAAFVIWWQTTFEAQQQQATLRHVTHLLGKMGRGKAFTIWRRAARFSANGEVIDERALKYAKQMFAGRWMTFAFRKIRKVSDEEGERLLKLEQSVRRFKYCAVLGACSQWRESAAATAETRGKVMRAARKFKSRMLFVAFYTLRLAGEREAKACHKMKQVASIMQGSTKARAFFTWSSLATECLLAKEVGRRACQAFRNRRQLQAMYQWQIVTDKANREVMELARANQYVRRTWMNRKMRAALNKWLSSGQQWLALLIATENIAMRAKLHHWRNFVTVMTEHPHSQLAMRVKVLTKFRTSKAYARGVMSTLMFMRWKQCVKGKVSAKMTDKLAQRAGSVTLAGERCKAFWRGVDRTRMQDAMERWKYKLMMRWVKERAMLLPLPEVDPGTTLMPWPGMGNY